MALAEVTKDNIANNNHIDQIIDLRREIYCLPKRN